MPKHMLVLPDGTEISSGGQGTALGSVKLTQSVNPENELTPGGVCAAMLETSLLLGADPPALRAGDAVKLYEDGTLLGCFLLEKPTRAGANVLRLTAYDRVSLLDRELAAWLSGLNGWPYTLTRFASMVCGACGLTLTGEVPGGDYKVQKFTADSVTGRQLMTWVAQAAGRFCRATPAGALELAWYRERALEIGPAGQAFYYQGSLSYEEYQVPAVARVRVQLTQDDVGVTWPVAEGEANTLNVTGNYLLTTDAASALTPVAKQIFTAVKDLTYTPCKLTVPSGLGVQAGDILTVTDGNGARFSILVMTWTHEGGRDTLESTGSRDRAGSEALNNTGYRALSGKMFEVKKSIEGLSARARALESTGQAQQERVSALELTAKSLTASVSSVETRCDKQEKDITTLQVQADGLSASVSSVEKRCDAQEKNITTLQATATSLSASVSSVKTDIKTAEGDISNIRTRVEKNEADIKAASDSITATVKSTTEDLTGIRKQLTELTQDADSLNLSIQNIEKNGVSQVTTTTGYTFNDKGLTIRKSGSEIENRMDNTGMYVTRDGDTMLQANAAGVVATDVTIRNFLIVGDHARFESYPTNRIACFYV